MKRLLAAILVSAAAFAVTACIGDDDVPKDPAQQHHYWMNKKLEWSQSILGDLAKTDWDKMGQDARKSAR